MERWRELRGEGGRSGRAKLYLLIDRPVKAEMRRRREREREVGRVKEIPRQSSASVHRNVKKF